MKKFFKIFFNILLAIVVLGVGFCFIDSLRVHGDEEPIFAFNQKIIDYEDYSAIINIGLGYKIIRYSGINQPEIIKIGTIFMNEDSPYDEEIDKVNEKETNTTIEKSGDNVTSGESGEEEPKVTTFGEKYRDLVTIEGMNQEVDAQNINSKLRYSMLYYYDLFDYKGYEDHDKYIWNAVSGDVSSVMTIYDISSDKAYNDSLEEISKEKAFEEVSGDESGTVQKAYFRNYKENDIEKVNYVYIMWLDDLKIRVDLFLTAEAQDGIGVYMQKMAKSIARIK